MAVVASYAVGVLIGSQALCTLRCDAAAVVDVLLLLLAGWAWQVPGEVDDDGT